MIRYKNILNKKDSDKLQIRVGNEKLINLNIVGVLLNSSSLPLSCFKGSDLIDIKSGNKTYAFGLTIDLFKKMKNATKKKLHYWFFE